MVGNRTQVKVVKNKVAPPFKKVEFDILYGEGVSRLGDVVDMATARNLIEKTGTWFSYKEERLGQGRDNAITFLQENPTIVKKLEKEIYASAGLQTPEEANAKATDEKGDGKGDGKAEGKKDKK